MATLDLDVPDALHDRITAIAAARGQCLQDYLHAMVTDAANQPDYYVPYMGLRTRHLPGGRDDRNDDGGDTAGRG